MSSAIFLPERGSSRRNWRSQVCHMSWKYTREITAIVRESESPSVYCPGFPNSLDTKSRQAHPWRECR
jgi:hypothetical protein